MARAAAPCLCLALLAGCKPPPAPLRVAAAADLARAFPEVAAAFQRAGGRPVTFSFGSSGQLARQLAEGAPFDAFAAADAGYADEAVRAGACDGASRRVYARGRLVAWWRAPAALPPRTLADLADPRFHKIALANPAHAPYGRAARQALERAGVWAAVEKKLVYGENVQQALAFARGGDADLALVGASLAAAEPGGGMLAVDGALHDPLDQAMVACRGGGAPADGLAFLDFVASPAGRAVLRRHGFLLPGEAP